MKRFLAVIPVMLYCTIGYSNIAPLAVGFEPQPSQAAYQQYEKRPKNELSKLIYLMDLFKGTDYKVVYDHREYDAKTALQEARNYIAKHYDARNQDALGWVQIHAYRPSGGDIIYLKFPDGHTEVLRDVLAAELGKLGH